MKIKKYCVDNIQEGMQLIKKELGPDAIIIQSRKVRERGWRGFFTPPKIEITAAADTAVMPFQAALAGQEQAKAEDKLHKELSELKQLVSRLVSGQQRREIEAKGPFYQWMQQLIAHDELVKSSTEYLNLADRRYREGIDNQLTLLDAQRQLFNAQQQRISTQFAQLASEIRLYKALGGGYTE